MSAWASNQKYERIAHTVIPHVTSAATHHTDISSMVF